MKVECSTLPSYSQKKQLGDGAGKRKRDLLKLIEEACFYSHATLHLQGADSLHSVLHDVLAARGEFTTPALEMLLIINGNLRKKQMCKYTQISLVQHVVSDDLITYPFSLFQIALKMVLNYLKLIYVEIKKL